METGLAMIHNFSILMLLIGNAGLVFGVFLFEMLSLLFRSNSSFSWRRVFDISLGFWVAVGIFKGWSF